MYSAKLTYSIFILCILSKLSKTIHVHYLKNPFSDQDKVQMMMYYSSPLFYPEICVVLPIYHANAL